MATEPSGAPTNLFAPHLHYDPHMHRDTDKYLMSNWEAFVSLLKCSIGTGCLAMPMAFKDAGWINAFLSTIIIGIIVTYALNLVIYSMHRVCILERIPYITYPEAMRLALRDGPHFLRWLSTPAKIFVDFFLATYHFGISCVYVVFVADSISQVVNYYYDMEIAIRIYIAILTIPFMVIYLIRDLKHLVPFSLVANILLLLGFGFVLYYVFLELPHISNLVMFNDITEYPSYFGTVLFAMESVGVIIAIEENMKNPKSYLGLFGILSCGMAVVIFLYILIGFFGYWRYEEDIQASITLNIPKDEVLAQVVTLVFALAIYLSYALQGYVTTDVIWHHYLSNYVTDDRYILYEYLVRCAIALGTIIFALCIPKLDLFLALVGSFCLSFLGLIFPGLIDICVKYHTGYGPRNMYLAQGIFLIVFGVLGFVLGTGVAIKNIIESYIKEYEES